MYIHMHAVLDNSCYIRMKHYNHTIHMPTISISIIIPQSYYITSPATHPHPSVLHDEAADDVILAVQVLRYQPHLMGA